MNKTACYATISMPASQKSSCQTCDVLIKTLTEKFPEMSDTLTNLVFSLTSFLLQRQQNQSQYKNSLCVTQQVLLQQLSQAKKGKQGSYKASIPKGASTNKAKTVEKLLLLPKQQTGLHHSLMKVM